MAGTVLTSNTGLEWVAEQIAVAPGMYLVLGTGNTTPTNNDTTLVAENFRKEVTARIREGVVVNFYIHLADADAVGTWYEYGIVVGGTTTKDSGTLLFRGLISFTKGTSPFTFSTKISAAGGSTT